MGAGYVTTQLTLESLGLSAEDIRKRVIQRLCDQITESGVLPDEDGMQDIVTSKLTKRVKELVNERVDSLFDLHVAPKIGETIEGLVLQETNRWGEKTGRPLTFVEFLVSRCEEYIREPVNFDGKGKAEMTDSYGWKGAQSRLTWLVHKHLQYSIETAMKSAVQTVQSAIAPALENTVRMKLEEISKSLKVTVQAK